MRQKSWVRHFDRVSVVHSVQMCCLGLKRLKIYSFIWKLLEKKQKNTRIMENTTESKIC